MLSVACACPRVEYLSVRRRKKLPPIAVWEKRHTQHTVRTIKALLAVRLNPQERCESSAPSPHDELPDSSPHIATAVSVLRGETLVIVVVAGQHNISAAQVKYSPESVQA